MVTAPPAAPVLVTGSEMMGVTPDPRLRLPLQERRSCKGRSDEMAVCPEMMHLAARLWRRWFRS